ncbi:MAG: UDP-N-acetylglucosamine--N-acetylmuramyl-(pentapeptide) pyrophosphoryl-undecaprenol N-acetylglucosamine transferase [Chlamydiales bacterium]|nr:UDP-N-acetylglucosamine--N-acetylmuramyl-(pentapeptide) pyrophosphoryl-undecaprenol N-acetylglucosamine transferase [Chlamydiales bacterium]
MKKKVVIAAGGSGGHLFPAQALADEICKEGIDVFFAGAGLDTNPYFDKTRYPYASVESATVFCRNIWKMLKALFFLRRGLISSFKLLKKENPDLVIGFGSFHSFPILFAARLQKRKIALFESNAYPGKVNRLFASGSLFTAIIFSEARPHLKGKIEEVAMPLKSMEGETEVDPYLYFKLDSSLPTLLFFGGSQGAVKMNVLFAEAVQLLKEHGMAFQVLHITGKEDQKEIFQERYCSLQIRACVKSFEKSMPLAYRIADLAICRSGAATVSELIGFSVPSILIPFPHAADDHQTKNAWMFQEVAKGGIYLPQKGLVKEILCMEIYGFLDGSCKKIVQMKQALDGYKKEKRSPLLSDLITRTLNTI